VNNHKTLKYNITSLFGRKMKFKFRYQYIALTWRAYIEKSPDYGYQSATTYDTHRNYDSKAKQYYVCWSENLKRIEDIITVSKVWAERTVDYIETGKRF
jgi:hypothetical protein